MTMLDFINTITAKLEEIKGDYVNFSKESKEELETYLNDKINSLSNELKSMFISKKNLVTTINELQDKIVVGKALDSEKAYGLTLEELKQHILPTSNIIDFKLVINGSKIRFSYDQPTLEDGYMLFCPHNRYEYDLARRYLLALGKPTYMGPLGIYYDGDDIPGRCCTRCWHSNIPLNSDGMGRLGWKVVDGSPTWWASDRTDVTEPNGDYTKYAYLGITYDNNGYVRWYNDAGSRYAYGNYLTVKRNTDDK